jgi:hypothetical protein
MPRDGNLLERRDRDIAGRQGSNKYEDLIKVFGEVRRGFEDQSERACDIDDNWDAYHCCLTSNQVYNGNTEYYVPIVRNAVNARKTRFLNQMFPSSGRYIDATSSDGSVPHAQVALVEHYIRKAHMKTRVIAAMLRNGDLEGQYNLLLDWGKTERHVVSRETTKPEMAMPGAGPVEVDGEGVEDLVFEDIVDAGPTLEVLHDTDVLIQPVTADSVVDALMQGGQVTVIRRWTKSTLEGMIARGEVRRSEANTLLEMSGKEDVWKDAAKASIDAAGVKSQGKFFLVHKTWKVMETEEGRRLVRILYGGYGLILSCRRIEFWNDRCPLLSVPIEKISGVVKGVPPVSAVMSHQYHANDVANQAADSMTLSMLPIIMTDPAKNPRTATMIINLGAIWEIDPNSTKFVEFPPLWRDAIPAIQADTTLAFQTLGVNPAMLPQQTGRPGAKRNQAEIALEQTVDILTTVEACNVVEEGILTPMVEHMVEIDHQFRDDEITVHSFGEMGIIAKMERVPPIQLGNRYYFTWFGVEQARNAQQLQQQIAFLNVAKGLSPDLAKNGYMLNPAPALEHAAGNIFGWRQGRQILVDARSSLAMQPEIENDLLRQTFFVPVHPLDEDPRHIQSHSALMQAEGDPSGEIREHIKMHMVQMQAKASAAMRQQQAQLGGGQPGMGQGGGASPVPGGQPQMSRLVRGPPGAIHPDQMPRAGAAVMPRKM